MPERVSLGVGGRPVTVTRPQKMLYPTDGLSKLDVARYFVRAAEYMLPHLRGRPLVLQRFPDGVAAEGFYQKRVPDHYPAWLKRVEVPLAEGGTMSLLQVDDAAGLVYLADQGVITLHVWNSRARDPERPERIVWDLDPPPDGDFALVRRAARWLGDLLEELGLVPFVMTTGSKGLHVVSPIKPEQDFEPVRRFAQEVAQLLAKHHPDQLTTAQRKDSRRGRLYLDVMRNALGQTAVAPYSLRPLAGAPIATPLDWRELSRADLRPFSYRMKNIFRRLGQKSDPWKDMHLEARSLRDPSEDLESTLA